MCATACLSVRSTYCRCTNRATVISTMIMKQNSCYGIPPSVIRSALIAALTRSRWQILTAVIVGSNSFKAILSTRWLAVDKCVSDQVFLTPASCSHQRKTVSLCKAPGHRHCCKPFTCRPFVSPPRRKARPLVQLSCFRLVLPIIRRRPEPRSSRGTGMRVSARRSMVSQSTRLVGNT